MREGLVAGVYQDPGLNQSRQSQIGGFLILVLRIILACCIHFRFSSSIVIVTAMEHFISKVIITTGLPVSAWIRMLWNSPGPDEVDRNMALAQIKNKV